MLQNRTILSMSLTGNRFARLYHHHHYFFHRILYRNIFDRLIFYPSRNRLAADKYYHGLVVFIYLDCIDQTGLGEITHGCHYDLGPHCPSFDSHSCRHADTDIGVVAVKFFWARPAQFPEQML